MRRGVDVFKKCRRKTLNTILYFWEETGNTDKNCRNPYIPSLSNGLKSHGFLLKGVNYKISKKELKSLRTSSKIIHLNFLHPFYSGANRKGSVKDVKNMLDLFSYALSIGYKIIWTFHNIYPHDTRSIDLDSIVRYFVTSNASAIIAHCPYAANRCVELFNPKQRPVVIPQGNYIGYYPNNIGRKDARKRFGFKESDFVFGFSGNVRSYKGVNNILNTFAKLDDENARLLLNLRVKLKNIDEDETTANIEMKDRLNAKTLELVNFAEQDLRIKCVLQEWIPNNEYQYFFGATDVVVFPFKNILTSASTMLALSYAKPVIIPRIGCIPDLVDETMGELYDASNPNGLLSSMEKIRNRDIISMGTASYKKAKMCDWKDVGKKTADVYKNVLHKG